MSRTEQAALVAFFNAFKLSKPLDSFDQLSDGKALMEALSSIDGTHFRNVGSRGVGSSPSGSENWVLKMNTLKRLHRLLLSYPLPPPRPSSLALSSMKEPPFSSIAKSPTSVEGRNGLVQICRMCLSVAVWAPGNEKVIMKIQKLGEADMAELMRGIEQVMATFPVAAEEDDATVEVAQEESAPARNVRAERDTLVQENEQLRSQCEQLMQQISEISSKLDEAREERDDAARKHLSTSQGPSTSTRSGASDEIQSLQADLLRTEQLLAATEAELEKSSNAVVSLTKAVDDGRVKEAEANKLKDQLDEHRHAAERLRKSENVIEKYKKKLEDSANLRREIRAMEEANTSLVDRNAALEADMKQAGSSKGLSDNYRSQIEMLEEISRQQLDQITELQLQVENSRAELLDMEAAYTRDRDELQLHQERVRELELAGGTGLNRTGSKATLLGEAAQNSLGDELGAADGDIGRGETKTDLKMRIRALEKEIEEARTSGTGGNKVVTLETLLADAKRARDRYQTDYLVEHRSALRLEAVLERIRSGKGEDPAQTSAALSSKIDELTTERDALLKEKQQLEVASEFVESKLKDAHMDLSLVDKDKQQQLSILRESVSAEAREAQDKVSDLRSQIENLKDKERANLEEIKKLLMDKVDLQSTGISQRERALEREQEFSEIRASLAASGASPEIQQMLLEFNVRNQKLEEEIKSLNEQMEKAKTVRDPLSGEGGAKGSVETRIITLKEKLLRARVSIILSEFKAQVDDENGQQTNAAMERRYKLEQQLMLSAWHELGSRTVRDHLNASGMRRVQAKPVPTSWLGRQRRTQEEAMFTRP